MTTPPAQITDEQLAQWEKLCEEATEGPWESEYSDICNRNVITLHEDYPNGRLAEMCCTDSTGFAASISNFACARNAELFAASRSALPALIAEVRRLRDDSTLNMGNDNKRDGRSQRQQYKDRVASLEAQLVSMREALGDLLPVVTMVAGCLAADYQIAVEAARSALSASADYTNKVVVDRAELKWLSSVMNRALSSYPSLELIAGFTESIARLDSLRSTGGGE